MKRYIALFALVLFTTSAVADCRSFYQKKFDDRNESGAMLMGAAGLMFTFATVGSFGNFAVGGIIAAPFAASSGIIMLTAIKPKRMVKLIDESHEYVKSQRLPGRHLRKLFDKVDEGTFSRLELAQAIVDADLDDSLCGANPVSMRSLKNAIGRGDFIIVDHNE